jgi:hypothetical protein
MKSFLLFVCVYLISNLVWSQNVVIDTYDVNSITETSARTGGKITDDGGFPITARGVVYSTDSDPTVETSPKTINGSGTGIFLSTLSGLSPNTLYYVRAYATNSNGTSYGNMTGFITANSLFTFNFYKDRSIDTTLYPWGEVGTYPFYKHHVSITNNLALPPGVFFYIEFDSVLNRVAFETPGNIRYINSGDTVHMNTYDEGSIGAFYTDTLGLDGHASAKYKVKVGGKAPGNK